jgi:hypothetical protein
MKGALHDSMEEYQAAYKRTAHRSFGQQRKQFTYSQIFQGKSQDEEKNPEGGG